jgi:hypothetical protein
MTDTIEQLLNDNLYDSKDWRASNTVERIEWLISMLESKNEEIDMWLEQLEWARKDREQMRDALLLTLPFVKKDGEVEAVVHAALLIEE